MIHDCSWHQFIRVYIYLYIYIYTLIYIYVCVCPPESVIEQGMHEKYDEQLMMIAPQDVPVCVVLAQKSNVVNPMINHHP